MSDENEEINIDDDSEDSGPHLGLSWEIAVICVVILAIIATIGVTIFHVRRQKRRRRERAQQSTDSTQRSPHNHRRSSHSHSHSRSHRHSRRSRHHHGRSSPPSLADAEAGLVSSEEKATRSRSSQGTATPTENGKFVYDSKEITRPPPARSSDREKRSSLSTSHYDHPSQRPPRYYWEFR